MLVLPPKLSWLRQATRVFAEQELRRLPATAGPGVASAQKNGTPSQKILGQ